MTLLDAELVVEASEEQSPNGQASTKARTYSTRLSYEDQLHIFCLLLQNKLVGKISPWSKRDTKKPTYVLLVDKGLAAELLNSVSDTPVTEDQIPAIIKRFQGKEPPFSSFPRD